MEGSAQWRETWGPREVSSSSRAGGVRGWGRGLGGIYRPWSVKSQLSYTSHGIKRSPIYNTENFKLMDRP